MNPRDFLKTPLPFLLRKNNPASKVCQVVLSFFSLSDINNILLTEQFEHDSNIVTTTAMSF